MLSKWEPGLAFFMQQINENDDSISGYLNLNDILSNENLINLFPNPTNGIFNLQLVSESILKGELLILNIEGKRVYEESVQLSNNEILLIDISKQRSGTYFIYFSVENDLVFNKMINIQK